MSQLFLPSSPEPDLSSSNTQQHAPTLTFSASTSQVGHIADLLNTVTSISSHALMIISDNGIVVFSEYNHISNVQLTIDLSLFSSYSLVLDLGLRDDEPKELRLGVDIQMIADSFTAAASTLVPKFKSSTSSKPETVLCYIKYGGEGNPLVIEFEDRLMSEKIEFATFYLDIDYPYDKSEDSGADLLVRHDMVQFELIVKSDLLTVLLQDLQHINTENLYIYVSNCKSSGSKRETNQLNFISTGAIGYLKLLFPSAKTMMEKLEIFKVENGTMEPTKDSVLSCFSFSPFIKIFKAVKLSSKCKLMKDVSGILSLQLLCKHPGVANYPGSLITFNIIEKALVGDESEQLNAAEVNGVFDDNHYHYIENYDQLVTEDVRAAELAREAAQSVVAQDAAELVEPPAPFGTLSYASFKKPQRSGQPSETQASKRQKHLESRHDDQDDRDVSVNGPVEIPIFL